MENNTAQVPANLRVLYDFGFFSFQNNVIQKKQKQLHFTVKLPKISKLRDLTDSYLLDELSPSKPAESNVYIKVSCWAALFKA